MPPLPEAPPAARRALSNKWLITASVSFGTLMGSIDSSIVNVALPQIRASVGATTEEITWASTGYIIATVLIMPLPGFLGRLFGQKRAYLGCLALFILGSALCGLAWNLPSLVLFRALQGLGAGALPPTEQAILRQTFPQQEQGMAMAVFTTVVTAGPAFGPTLGGYIVDNFHWAWIFFINLPIGVVGFFLVWRFVEDPEDVRLANRAAAENERRNLDWPGISLLCVSLASLQFVLEEGQSHDWFESPLIVGFALVAGISLPAFVLRELTAPAPVVHLRLFKDLKFTSGVVLGGIMFLTLVSGLFLLSLLMQDLLGFTAMDAGLALMPRTLVMIVTMPIIGRLYRRLSPWLLIIVGLVITGVGVYQMSLISLDTGSKDIVLSIMLQGLGTAMLFVPLNTVVLDGIARHRMADAAGLSMVARQLGSSTGLAVFATLLARYTTHARVGLLANVVDGRPEVIERLAAMRGGLMARGMDAAQATSASLSLLAGSVERQATVLAFDRLFMLGAILCAATLPLLFVLRASSAPPRAREAAHVEVEG